MNSLKIVILCGQSARHHHVANALCDCEVADVRAIIQEAGTEWTPKKIRRLLKPKALWRKVHRFIRDRKRYVGNPEAKWFFGENTPRLIAPEKVVLVPHINHKSAVTAIDQHDPDLICVFGTSLLRGELLTKGRLGIVNLHGGLSPEYRGADCTFWALHNAEPEKVGCTLHWIDRGIDTGGLIAHVSPEIRADDGELELFWRGVQDSAVAYCELLRRLAAGERFGQRQPHKGRLYQVKMRDVAAERRVNELLSGGLLAKNPLGPRVTWFPAEPSAN